MDSMDRDFMVGLLGFVVIATCVLVGGWVVFAILSTILSMPISQAMSYVLVGMLGWLIGRVQR